MEHYTKEQRVFIIEQYFKNNESLATTIRKFHTKYGQNNILTFSTVKKLIEKFKESGSVENVKQTGRSKPNCTNDNIETLQESVSDNPETSIRQRGEELQISKTSVQRLVTKDFCKTMPIKRKHNFQLEPGLSGFLCTCNSKLTERDCVRESYNILNEFADKLFGIEEPFVKSEEKSEVTEGNESEEDIDAALEKEVESIKSEITKKPDVRRFQVIQSGANGIVFIRTTVPDPVKLAHTILTSASNVQKSKYLLRLLPVEVTCKAYIDDICKSCDSLFDKYFSGEEKTFAIVYNHRNNDRIKRDELIEKVAALVSRKNEKHKTDLKNPKLAVLIEIIRSICCISVVPDFYTLKKYNLMELAVQKNEQGKDNE